MKPNDRPEDGGNQNRRGFLKTGAASIAAGLSAGAIAPYASGEMRSTENSPAAARTIQDMMPTRNLGKTLLGMFRDEVSIRAALENHVCALPWLVVNQTPLMA